MQLDSIRLTRPQVTFLMQKFQINDPNEAIDYFIELLVLEEADPMSMKRYILGMMERELSYVHRK